MNTETNSGDFAALGLCEPILQALSDKGYSEPTAIQSKAIGPILEGRDIMASAQTGTGKTAGFVLPLLEHLRDGKVVKKKHARILILTPTRELAAQVHQSIIDYGRHMKHSAAVVFGGVKIEPQVRKLGRGVDFLIATPGRLMDLFGQKAIHFDDIDTLVLDEADRMLDMGFLADIKRIQKVLPKEKQTLLFSATFSDEIRALAHQFLDKPVEVDVAPKNSTVEAIRQLVYTVDKKRKTKLLSYLISQNKSEQVLVFSRTKHGANRLVRELYKDGIPATAIHGNKSQNQRTKALADFKDGKATVLVATDIAARGIDIQDLPLVVNFDLPNVPEDYVHRIGRTGRAGSSGRAISLVSADEIKQLQDIEKLIQKHLEREEIEGFETDHDVPASKPIPRNVKAKKPRRPRENAEGEQGNGGARRDNAGRNNNGRGRSNSNRSNSDSNRNADSANSRRPNRGGGRGRSGGGEVDGNQVRNTSSQRSGNEIDTLSGERPDNFGNRQQPPPPGREENMPSNWAKANSNNQPGANRGGSRSGGGARSGGGRTGGGRSSGGKGQNNAQSNRGASGSGGNRGSSGGRRRSPGRSSPTKA